MIRTASTYVLDLEPKCRCGNHAVVFIETHNWGNCYEEPTTGSFKCKVCRDDYLSRLAWVCSYDPCVCICGRQLVTPSDMIVRIVPLTKQDKTC